MASNQVFFRLGSLTPLSAVDLNTNQLQADPLRHRPGSISIMVDAFGLTKIFRYIQNGDTTNNGQFQMLRRPALVSQTVTSANNTTTNLVGSALTADTYNGRMVYVFGGTAGTAPDGEVGICTRNDTTNIKLDAGYPLSAAPSTGTVVAKIISSYHSQLCGTADLAQRVQGVVVGQDGIDGGTAPGLGNYGWVQQEGPAIVHVTTTALTENVALETSATAGWLVASVTLKQVVGYAMSTSQTNATTALVYLKCFTPSGNI